MMEIRRQMLGIIIGVFITISFITPVLSYVSTNDDVCEMKVYRLIEVLHKVKKGEYFKSDGGYYRLKQ